MTGAPRGFALLNALIVVAALSGIAVLLLARAEDGRTRLAAGLEADRHALALDAGEALARQVLRDNSTRTDHAGEPWAGPLPAITTPGGAVSVAITDLQGRFNLAWLRDPDDRAAQAALDRLVAALGLSPAIADALRNAMQDTDPQVTEALRGAPGLSLAVLERLAPHIAILPGGSRVNLYTATPQVLAAILPRSGLRPERLAEAVQDDPPTSVRAALQRGGMVRLGADDGFGIDRLSVTSDWFEARITVAGAETIRHVVLHRPDGAQPRAAFRITVRP